MAAFIHEENIAVFTHNLDNQGSLNVVPNLVLLETVISTIRSFSTCSIDSITAPCKYFLKP